MGVIDVKGITLHVETEGKRAKQHMHCGIGKFQLGPIDFYSLSSGRVCGKKFRDSIWTLRNFDTIREAGVRSWLGPRSQGQSLIEQWKIDHAQKTCIVMVFRMQATL